MSGKTMDKSDTIHQIYSNHKIKQQLVDYVYAMVDVSKFKYKMLKTDDDLKLLSVAKYFVSGNYAGSNCLMVFTRNKDRYYSFLLDRKTLSYKQSQINIDNVAMFPIELGLDETIYDGTIIDGILSQTNNGQLYTITDVYVFRGEDLTMDKVKYKLINVRKYFDTYVNQKNNINSIDINVNHLYELGEIKNLVDHVIPNTKRLQVRGLAFYPDTSGTKLLFMFDKSPSQMEYNVPQQTYRHQRQNDTGSSYIPQNASHQSEVSTGHKYRMNNMTKFKHGERDTMSNSSNSHQCEIEHHMRGDMDISHELGTQKYRYINKTNDTVVLTFEIRRTEQHDVYKIFLVFPYECDGRKILKTKKIGIACIPTIACSKLCNECTFATGKSLMKCKYDETKEKWIPFERDVVKKCPDYVSTLEEKMELIIDDE